MDGNKARRAKRRWFSDGGAADSPRRRKICLCCGICTAAVIVLAAVLFYGWNAGWFLPGWIEWKSGDRIVQENSPIGVRIDHRRVAVYLQDANAKNEHARIYTQDKYTQDENAQDKYTQDKYTQDENAQDKYTQDECTQDIQKIWSSPEDILVQDSMICDIDGDGAVEILLLCWKIGRFGVSRPFWVERDEKSWSQHLFVYEYGADGVTPQWMSSYMGMDVAELSVSGAVDKPVLQFRSPDGSVSCWFWDSWGFTRLD